MRINEILTESQQLDEGPLGSAVGAVGRGIGKTIGGVAKAAGAVGGVWQGAKKAFAKGKQAAIDTIAGDGSLGGDTAPAGGGGGGAPAAAAPSGGGGAAAPAAAAPAAEPAAGAAAPPTGGATPPTAQQINKQGPKGSAAAQPQSGAGAQAIQKTAQATQGASAEKAGQTVYAQVKSQINNLDKKGKQRILQLLQKSLTQPAPADQKAAAANPAAGAAPAAAAPGASPKAGGTGFGFNPDTGKPFASAAEKTAYDASPEAKMSTADVEKASTTAPAAAPATAEPAAAKKKGGRKKAAAPSQAEIDADRERLMGPTSDSKINTGNPLAEALAAKVEEHKRQMFEQSLRKGEFSIFVK